MHIELVPLDQLWHEITTGRICAAYLLAGHPCEAYAKGELDALATVEFFVVQMAVQLALNKIASVMLSGARVFETADMFTNVHGRVQY